VGTFDPDRFRLRDNRTLYWQFQDRVSCTDWLNPNDVTLAPEDACLRVHVMSEPWSPRFQTLRVETKSRTWPTTLEGVETDVYVDDERYFGGSDFTIDGRGDELERRTGLRRYSFNAGLLEAHRACREVHDAGNGFPNYNGYFPTRERLFFERVEAYEVESPLEARYAQQVGVTQETRWEARVSPRNLCPPVEVRMSRVLVGRAPPRQECESATDTGPGTAYVSEEPGAGAEDSNWA
jgi:hypothetical protein